MEQPKIYVFTRAYNAEKTIRRAVESVLNQTYQNITYVIRDNGSTDNTYLICKKYADRDQRVVLVRNSKNNSLDPERDKAVIQLDCGLRYGTALGENDFFCLLDADDEYMPNFFEQAVKFAQEEYLDIIIGGSEMIEEDTGENVGDRTFPQNYLISGIGFSKYFPQYHWFMRQVWGKLFRKRVLLGTLEYRMGILQKELGERAALKLPYGDDTLCTLHNFQLAKRVGILSGCQHRWYIQNKSVSKTLQPNRLEADSILYRTTLDFLIQKGNGPISAQNRLFLQMTYADAVMGTVNLIHDSDLSAEDKLHKYRIIAENPLTQAVYRECASEEAAQSRSSLLQAAILAGSGLAGQGDDEDLRVVMQELSPHCGKAVTRESLTLFLNNQELLQALIDDAPKTVLESLLLHLEQGKDTKKHAIPAAIQALAIDHPLLCQISDAAFLKKYARIYLMVWQKETLAALDEMTGLLLEEQVTDGKETFLQLYISLAAMENQAPAFVFGQFQLAWLFLRQGRREECRAVVDELTELGVENEELVNLRQELNGMGNR